MKLSEQCMLAILNIGMFNGEITDKETTNELCSNKHASSGEAKVRKWIYPKQSLAGPKAAAGKARAAFRMLTFPWMVDGTGILPSKNYMTLIQEMSERKREFYAERDKFIASMDKFREFQKTKLGDLYDESDYPYASEVEASFNFECSVMPMADAGDFRVQLAEEERNEIVANAEEKAKGIIETAQRQLAARLLEPLEKLVNTLANKEKSFEYTTIANVIRIIDLIPQMNLTNDPELNKAQSDLRECLTSCVSFDKLFNEKGDGINSREIGKAIRADEVLRETKAKEAEIILNRLKACGF